MKNGKYLLFFLFLSLLVFVGTNEASAANCVGGSISTKNECLAKGMVPLGGMDGSSSGDQVCCMPAGTSNLTGGTKSSSASGEGQCTTEGTSCTNMDQEGKDWVDPAGMDCWYENVCNSKPVMRACCRKSDYKPSAGQNNTGKTNTGLGNTTPQAGGTTSFTNPLKFSTVEEFLGGIMSAIQKIIVVLALTFMVFGAFMYVTAGANPDNAETGKKAIVSALVGLAIALAAPSLLKELGATIGWGDVNGSAVGGALGISDIALRVLNFLLGTMGIVALVMMVIGATLYLTSAGDEDRIDQGKDIFKYSVIGIIMAMAAMILVKQVAQFFI